jgi:hypothetical protein
MSIFSKNKQKYSEVVLLVHPLYNVLYNLIENNTFIESVSSVEELFITLKKDKKLNVQLKKSLAAYGKKILEYKDKPNTVFILVEALPTRPVLSTNEFVYKQMLDKFVAFGKKHLKERFVITSSNPIIGEIDSRLRKKLVPRSVLKKLKPSVSISAFGEYADKGNCVRTWSAFLVSILRANKIKINNIEIINEISLFKKSFSGKKLNDRLDFGHSRRAAQKRKKKINIRRK